MTAARVVASVQLLLGGLLVRRPRAALGMLGYPADGSGPRAVVRVLGGRHLAQGAAELSARHPVLLAGAAVDVLHASTALLYAHRSERGRRAGRRNASLALCLAAAELVVAARTPGRRSWVSAAPPAPTDLPANREQGGDSACWLPLVCEGCGALADDPEQLCCSRCGQPR